MCIAHLEMFFRTIMRSFNMANENEKSAQQGGTNNPSQQQNQQPGQGGQQGDQEKKNPGQNQQSDKR